MDKVLISIIVVYYFGIIFLMYYMFNQRKAAIKAGVVGASYFKSYQGETPRNLQIIHNHVNNQFQLPLVFFFATLLNLQQGSVNANTLILAFVFVMSRLFHTYIHLGKNDLIKRSFSYLIGAISIGLMLLQPLFS